MKIKDEDLKKIKANARRVYHQELSKVNSSISSKIHKNKKKYNRKNKHKSNNQ